MLNHKFYLDDQLDNNEGNFIRISDEFMSKLKPDLLKYKFTWNGFDEPQYGLDRSLTFLNTSQINQLKLCLLKQSQDEKEYNKFISLIDKAINENREIRHVSGERGLLVHNFIICDKVPSEIKYSCFKNKVPSEIKYSCFKNKSIEIQDQFILDNYDVFSQVKLYWRNLSTKEYGFNYYGVTIISPEMAQTLLDVMHEYLKDNHTEKAEYFLGEEYDILRELLTDAISENKFIIHYGV